MLIVDDVISTNSRFPNTQKRAKDTNFRSCANCDVLGRGFCNPYTEGGPGSEGYVPKPKFVEKGKIIIMEGHQYNGCFVSIHGILKIYKSLPDGRIQIIGYPKNGHLIGFSLSKNYTYSVEAMENAEVCWFQHSRHWNRLKDVQSLEMRLLAAASSELGLARDHMVVLGFKSARERLAHYLLARFGDVSARDTSGDGIPLPRRHR